MSGSGAGRAEKDQHRLAPRRSAEPTQILKRWLTAQPDQPATVTQLRALLDRFTADYNHQRPHRSLGRRTPDAAYLSRPKATTPTGSPGDQPDTRMRRDRIDDSGVVTLRYHGRLHHVGVGRGPGAAGTSDNVSGFSSETATPSTPPPPTPSSPPSTSESSAHRCEHRAPTPSPNPSSATSAGNNSTAL